MLMPSRTTRDEGLQAGEGFGRRGRHHRRCFEAGNQRSLGVAERAKEVEGIVERLQPITNPNMKSDLTTATALARAAIQGALANVEINLESLKDGAFTAETRKKVAALTA